MTVPALNLKHLFRRKLFWRRFLGGMLAIAFLAGVARNQIVAIAIEQVGSSVLENAVSVRHVRVGYKTVQITGLEVKEGSLTDAPQLEIRTILVEPTIWRGLRQGVWLRYVLVREPTLHVRFDREGRLLSRFPGSNGGGTENIPQLPFDRATIEDAALVIHQEGKPVLSISGASLTTTVDESIHLRAEIADLLGTQLHIESRVDKSTFGGRTRVVLAPMHLDTRHLARLPLVSDHLSNHPVEGTLEAQLQIEHPANEFDFRKHVVDLRANLSHVVSAQYGPITKGLSLRAAQQDGCSWLAVDGPFARGLLQLNAHLNLVEQVPELTATYKLAGVDLEPVGRICAPDIAVAAIASAEGSARASWKDQVLTFRATLTPILSNIQAAGIPVGDLITSLSCDGSFTPHRKQALTGSLVFEIASEGIALRNVAHRFAIDRAEGQVALRGSGIIPLATLTDLQTYSASVVVESSRLACEGMAISPLSLDARLNNGTIDVMLPQATLAVESVADRLPDCWVSRLQLAETLQMQSRLESSVPLMRLLECDAWTVVVNVAVQGLAIAHEPISDFATSLQLAQGSVSLSPCSIQWRQTSCDLAGRGDLRDDGRVTVHFTAESVPLRQVAEVASRFSNRPLPVSGTAHLVGRVNLELSQLRVAADGKLTLSDVWYGRARIGDVELLWEADPKVAKLRSVSNDFFGGSYVVDATLQDLDWTRATITANGQDIQLKRLASVIGSQVAVTGLLDGGLRFGSIGDLTSLRADGWLNTRGASIAGAPIQLRAAKLSVAEGVATASIRGSAFDGSLALDATSRLAELTAWIQRAPQPIQQLPVFGRFQANDIALKQVIVAAAKRRSPTPVKGSVDFSCVRDPAAAQKGLLGAVVCSAENLRWNQALMSRRLRATGVLYPTRLKINNINGNFADGRLSGDADLHFARAPSGTFRFRAEHINLRRAAAPIPALSRSITGAGSVSISGRLGSLTSATAKVHASNITLGDLEIRGLRFPIDCSFQSQSSRVRWKSRGGSINVGGGTVAISSEGDLTNGLATMITNVKIQRVDSAKLMRGKSISAGILDGDINLQAKRAHAAKDLTGRFHLELSQIQSLELPGSEALTQLVKLPRLSGPTVDQRDGGTIDGRMAGGLLHLDRLALSKSGLLVLMDGTSTLDGRLDFDVTAFTNQSGPADGLLALADSPIMLAVSAPVALLAKANEAIKDRVIHVHVGGTGTRPTLRLQPAKTLSQDALRFFVASTLGSPVARMATRQRNQPIR